jgi:DeoR/GlpR family transcriptional regulator of sugar metabolism
VQPGQAIALGAGTTTWRLAHHLLDVADLTVVTNSLQVAGVLHRDGRQGLTVVLTGGVRTPSDALVGPVAVAALRSLHVDVLFTGVHGMAEDAGFTTPNLLEAETNWALISSAQRVVVIADHTKWGVRGLSRFASLDQADVLVTDSGLPAEARTVLGEHVDEVIVAPVRQRRAQAGDPGP